MNSCNISINVPPKFLKGAGLLNTLFLPAWIYKINIILENNSDNIKLCSFAATLANGIRYINNLQISGLNTDMRDMVHIVEPNTKTGNNNTLIFANSFKLYPLSQIIITLDVALCDKYTENTIENSGMKIQHHSILNFNGHLTYDNEISSTSSVAEAADYEMVISCDNKSISKSDTAKYYLECKSGQYDLLRSVYVRSVLDDGLIFIADSSNIEPKNVYKSDNKTILKWNLENIQPAEVKKIGFKVLLSDKYSNSENIKSGDILQNNSNSNCVNNSSYTQCPISCNYDLTVE